MTPDGIEVELGRDFKKDITLIKIRKYDDRTGVKKGLIVRISDELWCHIGEGMEYVQTTPKPEDIEWL